MGFANTSLNGDTCDLDLVISLLRSMLAVYFAVVAFTPSLQPLAASTRVSAAPAMVMDMPTSLLLADGVNSGIKQAFADALGPAADYAPYIGTATFLAVYSASTKSGLKSLIPKPGQTAAGRDVGLDSETTEDPPPSA